MGWWGFEGWVRGRGSRGGTRRVGLVKKERSLCGDCVWIVCGVAVF